MDQYTNPRLGAGAGGLCVTLVFFAVLGTVAALWPNPFYVRMTPAGSWEISLLGAQSVLLGLYYAVRPPASPMRTAGLGGLINFVGIACPICNKMLLVIFGTSTLMTYFEPVRVYVAALGIMVTVFALSRELVATQGNQGRQLAMRISVPAA
jgi:hypothetical protein